MKKNRFRLPGMDWLSRRLSRKMLLALVAMAAVSWIFMCQCFLAYLSGYARRAYDAVTERADDHAQNVADFLEGGGGDFNSLRVYLEKHDLGCIAWDENGKLTFAYTEPVDDNHGAIASVKRKVPLAGGRTVTLQIWTRSIPRQDLSGSLRHQARIGLSALNACVFLVVAFLIFTIVVVPVVRLRKTMRRYYERGEVPERSERQDEIGRLQNTFADMVGVLQIKEQAEHRLVASISHDIKTPLTSVMGYSERLLSGGLPPEKERRYLQCVYDKALSIKALVDEFDEYLDVGLRDTPMRLMKAKELCDLLREEYGAELGDAGVAFGVDCRCPESLLVCNPEHIKRFFGNLIGNSIRHAGAEHLELHMTCQKQEGQIEFRFRDNGRGVEPELLPRIFEPFYTTDRGRKVSGLGLSICRSIAKAHGGTVCAENIPEGGLMIRLLLPCAGV